MVGSPKKTTENGLVVNTVGGVDDKWSASQAMNLTYCVSTKFGSQYTNVVNAMAAGAGQWEAASSKVELHAPVGQRLQLHHAQQRGALLGRADQHHAVHRPGVLPEHGRPLAQRARQRDAR